MFRTRQQIQDEAFSLRQAGLSRKDAVRRALGSPTQSAAPNADATPANDEPNTNRPSPTPPPKS